jgi:23S rRNA pseudouridine1911/1915/1917 synthase
MQKTNSNQTLDDTTESSEDLALQAYEQFEVDETQAGTRLDVLLTQSFEILPSRSFATKLITLGAVQVNGKNAKSSYRCSAGDNIVFETKLLTERSQPPRAEKIPLEILYEDEHVLVINKPAGLVVHPGAGNPNGTLVNAVLAHCGQTLPSLGEEARAGIVHRLDRDTSGVMVVAKSQIALTVLSQQFASHTQERSYLALVLGVPKPVSGNLETWHGRDKNHRIRFAVVEKESGKIARMHYSTLQTFCNHKAALVRCQLYTGRTHQIRVQMKHIGCPLLGDPLYHGDYARLKAEKSTWRLIEPALTRQMLHAERLSFEHPVSRATMEFSCNPPADFLLVTQALEKESEHP